MWTWNWWKLVSHKILDIVTTSSRPNREESKEQRWSGVVKVKNMLINIWVWSIIWFFINSFKFVYKMLIMLIHLNNDCVHLKINNETRHKLYIRAIIIICKVNACLVRSNLDCSVSSWLLMQRTVNWRAKTDTRAPLVYISYSLVVNIWTRWIASTTILTKRPASYSDSPQDWDTYWKTLLKNNSILINHCQIPPNPILKRPIQANENQNHGITYKYTLTS